MPKVCGEPGARPVGARAGRDSLTDADTAPAWQLGAAVAWPRKTRGPRGAHRRIAASLKTPRQVRETACLSKLVFDYSRAIGKDVGIASPSEQQ